MPLFLARQAVAGGGGGGAGRSNNLGSGGGARGERVRGPVASVGNIDILTEAIAGGGANLSVAGAGGNRGEERDPGDCHAIGGVGGNGGFFGAGGAGGQTGQYAFPIVTGTGQAAGGAGGAGGLSVVGNSFITWGAVGTLYGGVV